MYTRSLPTQVAGESSDDWVLSATTRITFFFYISDKTNNNTPHTTHKTPRRQYQPNKSDTVIIGH